MKTSPDYVPSTGPSLRPSTEATPDAAARTPRSYAAECQARRQAEQAHEDKLRQRRARTQAANEAVSAYMRESGTRDYQRAFLHIQDTRPELFAGMQVPAHCRGDADSSEPARQEGWQRCGERIRAANAVVDEYRRTSGTTNYQAAFNHILRTRPELFADVQVPAGLVAENFNPNHDQLGRFTTSEDASGTSNKNGAADERDDGLDGQGGGETKLASIARYAYPREGKQNQNRCPLYSLQTIIAAKTSKEAPSEAEVQTRFDAEATRLGLKTPDWRQGAYIRNGDYVKIVQNVLKSYAVVIAKP